MIKNFRSAVIFLFIFFLFIGCSEKSSKTASEYSDSLIILKNASNVKYNHLNGTDQISYQIIAKYPAKETIAELNSRLEAKGWKPLKKGWLNPGIPTSHVRGWTNYIDGTKNPNLEVHSWISDWTDDKEDILVFSLKYSYPIKGATNKLVIEVIGIYIPEKVAKITVTQINDYKKSLK